jgi:hypothetical protein
MGQPPHDPRLMGQPQGDPYAAARQVFVPGTGSGPPVEVMGEGATQPIHAGGGSHAADGAALFGDVFAKLAAKRHQLHAARDQFAAARRARQRLRGGLWPNGVMLVSGPAAASGGGGACCGAQPFHYSEYGAADGSARAMEDHHLEDPLCGARVTARPDAATHVTHFPTFHGSGGACCGPAVEARVEGTGAVIGGARTILCPAGCACCARATYGEIRGGGGGGGDDSAAPVVFTQQEWQACPPCLLNVVSPLFALCCLPIPDCLCSCDCAECSHWARRVTCRSIERRYNVYRGASAAARELPVTELIERGRCLPCLAPSTLGFDVWPDDATDMEKRLLLALAHGRYCASRSTIAGLMPLHMYAMKN